MKKNSYLQIRIDTENLHKLKDKANSEGLSLSEFCRKKLLESCKLDKIEWMLSKVMEKK
jgi:predicted DNA binding CopG/RHH family protein